MIGYYVHHLGFGHMARALSIAGRMRQPVTILTSRQVPDRHPFTDVIRLPRDDTAGQVSEPTAHGTLHWAPHHDPGLGDRMQAIAQWVADARPEAVVVDVSVEVAAFVRLLGVPVIVVALPGERVDAPHRMVHRLADHIVAAWPHELSVPAWLRPHTAKTSYVGGISRFDGRQRSVAGINTETPGVTRVLVLGGAEGLGVPPAELARCERRLPDTSWTTLGAVDGWADDPWAEICAADVIVTHAGQGCIADVAAARKPAVVIPQDRPFGEQRETARVLGQSGLAAIVPSWPDRRLWPQLLSRTQSRGGNHWERWHVDGAAERAAESIEVTARRCAGRVA